MPTYEYQCQKCTRRQEALQSITAKPLTRCGTCGGKLKRLISSGAGFLFKGSGFYITDYRSQSYQDAKKKDQPAPPLPGTGPAASAPPASPPSKADKK